MKRRSGANTPIYVIIMFKTAKTKYKRNLYIFQNGSIKLYETTEHAVNVNKFACHTHQKWPIKTGNINSNCE